MVLLAIVLYCTSYYHIIYVVAQSTRQKRRGLCNGPSGRVGWNEQPSSKDKFRGGDHSLANKLIVVGCWDGIKSDNACLDPVM